jgi:hypothetical protein
MDYAVAALQTSRPTGLQRLQENSNFSARRRAERRGCTVHSFTYAQALQLLTGRQSDHSGRGARMYEWIMLCIGFLLTMGLLQLYAAPPSFIMTCRTYPPGVMYGCCVWYVRAAASVSPSQPGNPQHLSLLRQGMDLPCMDQTAVLNFPWLLPLQGVFAAQPKLPSPHQRYPAALSSRLRA